MGGVGAGCLRGCLLTFAQNEEAATAESAGHQV